MQITDAIVQKAAHVLARAPAAWTVEQEARAVLEAVLGDGCWQCVTDEMLEAAAKAMYERRASLWTDIKPPPWDFIPRDAREQWCEIARAGLKAAGGVAAVHLCDTCASFKVCYFRRLFQSLIDEEAPPVRVRACVTECEQYKPDARVQEVLAGARQGSTSQG